jgi:mandelamide amidase
MEGFRIAVAAFAAAVSLSSSFDALSRDRDVSDLGVVEAARLIRGGELSSEALARELLRRIAAHPELNAFITVDEAKVLEAARRADRERRRSRPHELGALHGVPLVVKDNIHVAGLPNSAGTPALKGFVPEDNAPVVQALLDAGALVLGKTNLHELAFGITSNNAAFGAVKTPYDATRLAGGSSGGTGAAVGARLAPAGLGTDTGGSVRIPAALNGIAGLRPTIHRYSQVGVTPISATRDTPGPMARSVEDLVLLDSVLTRDWRKVKVVPPRRIRLGVVPEMQQNLDAETAALTQKALDKLRRAGVTLVEVQMPGLADLVAQTGFPIALFEARRDLTAYLQTYGTGVTLAELAAAIASPDVKAVFDTFIVPGAIPESVYNEALNVVRPRLQQLYADTFKSARLDGIVFATTPLPAAPAVGSDETVELNGVRVPTFPTYIRHTDPGSIAGIPGVSLPMALTKSGLALGLEIDAPAGTDRHLLAVALTVEKILGELPAPRGF